MKRATRKTGPHIAMRIGLYQDRQLGHDVFEGHNDIASRQGTVYFGKAGRSLSSDKLQLLSDSIADGVNCNLFVARRSKAGYECSLARILSLRSTSRSLLQTLNSCRTSLMLVREGNV
jgi:hypothetical protein